MYHGRRKKGTYSRLFDLAAGLALLAVVAAAYVVIALYVAL